MTRLPLWQMTATELSALTRAGEVSALEAVGAAVERMQAANPALNAVVVDLSEPAMARARALDSQPQRGPLHGVPVTIKINVDQVGQATSNGLPALKDHVAIADAPLVRHLQEAGAVIIGRTNTPEFSFRADTDNPLFGRTFNPWDRAVSAGGSSGGAGAAVIAGIGALAHGNDIGGSLRTPAYAVGAVTVKPGLGRVAAWNPSQAAERGMLAQSMSVQGLITRSARDLALAMPVMIRPDPRDPWHVPLPWAGPALDGPLRVGMARVIPGFDPHPEVLRALDLAREALEEAGYQVEEIDPPGIEELSSLGLRALFTETEALSGADIRRLGSDTLRGIFEAYHQVFPLFTPDEHLRALARRSHHAREWSRLLDRLPLVLTPYQSDPMFPAGLDADPGPAGLALIRSGVWANAMNFMGLPAGMVPTHLAQTGTGVQPLGVQIVGRRWREDLVVQAMQAIEDRLGPMAPRLWAREG